MQKKKERTPKENVLLWIKALRSGKYTQTQGLLGCVNSQGEEFNCCLGVACRVLGEECAFDEFTEVLEYGGMRNLLSKAQLKKLGLTHDQVDYLVDLNDGEDGVGGATFDEIATHIEQTILPRLPKGC